jgi:hypothetical protein
MCFGRRRNHGLTTKLLLLVASTIASLLLLEGAVRWFLPYYSPNRQIHFHAVPGEGIALGLASQTVRQRTPKGDYDLPVRFNIHGFRDDKDLRDSKDSDWFVLGDSYSMGWGVPEEQRFSNVLESLLSRDARDERVFNIAIPEDIVGYQHLLSYAERHGAKVRRLIVGICMENDLRDYSDGQTAFERGLHGATSGLPKEEVRSWLKRNSALYVATSFSLQKVPFVRSVVEALGLSRNIQMLTGRNEWSEQVLKSSADELIELVSGRDALILIIPSRGLWQGDNAQTERRVHAEFLRLLRDAGLQILDLRGALESGGEPLTYYFQTDPHWNDLGHSVAGHELYRAIHTGRQG